MKLRKILFTLLPLCLLVFAAVIIIRLISGAFSLAAGALNTVLGIAVILALLAIVFWMFSYAKKHRK